MWFFLFSLQLDEPLSLPSQKSAKDVNDGRQYESYAKLSSFYSIDLSFPRSPPPQTSGGDRRKKLGEVFSRSDYTFSSAVQFFFIPALSASKEDILSCIFQMRSTFPLAA